MRCLTIEECNQWRNECLCQGPWKHQITCVTPLKRVPWFTAALVEQMLPFSEVLLMIDQVVFEVPPELEAIRGKAGEQRPIRDVPGHLFENDHEGFRAALQVSFLGWIDLRAFFSPWHHALLADHDEFTTFFSNSPEKIADVRSVLKANHVEIVRYKAKAP